MRGWIAGLVLACVACGEPAPTSAPTSASAPASAPASAGAHAPAPATAAAPAPSLPSGPLLAAGPDLRARPAPALLALVRGERLAEPRVHGAAELAGESGRVIWIAFSDSESLERWARARRDGTYAAERRALDARIAECENDEDPGCDCCASCVEQLDDEEVPTGIRIHLARISVPAGGEPRLDRSVVAYSGGATARFREIRDLDGDGRAEVGLAIHSSSGCGNGGDESTTFHWLDGDSLHPQLAVQHRAYAFGCSGTLQERSGFSVRDRNGDGRPDFGVRHTVWADGCPEIDGWPDPAAGTQLADVEVVRRLAMGEPLWMIRGDDDDAEEVDDPTCPFFDERLRFFYDAASDEWRAAGTDRD